MAVSTPMPRTRSKLSNWAPGRSSSASRRTLRTVLVTLLNAVLVALFVVVITFFLIRYLLGDPAYQYAMSQNGGHPPAAAAVAAARVTLGINSPILTQFWHYLTGLLHGNLGTSFQSARMPVTTLVWSGFSTTLVLAGLTVIVSTVSGTLLGLWLAVVRSRFLDNLVRIIAMMGIAAPPALVGLVSSSTGDILPAGGWGGGYPANFQYLVLPVVTLSAGFAPVIMRVVRERARAILAEEHIEAARTRGTPPLRLVLGHVLPECMVPLLRFIALNTTWLLSFAVVVEVVFGVPGLGRVLLTAANADDFPTIQACAMLLGFVVVICFAVAEIAGALIDPRTRQ
jgi:ABC-type dipeptide/oligopeptide/nickel transport system permease component